MGASVSAFCALIVKRIGSLICPHNRLRCFRGNVKPDYSTKSFAIVGVAETTRLGVIPDMSLIELHADAALTAMADAGLRPADIDGTATAGETPVTHHLGLTPKWVDGSAVGSMQTQMVTSPVIPANAGMTGRKGFSLPPCSSQGQALDPRSRGLTIIRLRTCRSTTSRIRISGAVANFLDTIN